MLPFIFKRIYTIGDGSCFIHALLGACNENYKNMNTKSKISIVRKMRILISQYIENSNIYKELSRGNLEEFSKFVPEVNKNNMINYMKGNGWINYIYIELFSKLFNINIFIISNLKKNKGELYKLGDDDIMYNKDRNSIFINYINELHFETLEIYTKNGWKSFFSKNSQINKYMFENEISITKENDDENWSETYV